jgi:hypothetical protein
MDPVNAVQEGIKALTAGHPLTWNRDAIDVLTSLREWLVANQDDIDLGIDHADPEPVEHEAQPVLGSLLSTGPTICRVCEKPIKQITQNLFVHLPEYMSGDPR